MATRRATHIVQRCPVPNVVKVEVKTEDVEAGDDIDEKPPKKQDAEKVVDAGEASTSKCGKRRKKQDFYGEEIFKPGGMRPPLNPYFVVDVTERRVNEMYISTYVIRTHKIKLPKTLLLVDPKWRTFETKRTSLKDGRVNYCGGWKTNYRADMLKIVFVFNFIKFDCARLCGALKFNFSVRKMVKHPTFFKFYVPWLGDEVQKIPPRFIQSLPPNWPKNLTLRDRYNNLWNVKVEMIGSDWYFKDGWEKFADDNKIKGGDMFIYEYFSHGLLDFKIHGGNGCLTEGAGGRIPRNIEEQQIIKIESDDGIVNHTDKVEQVTDDDNNNDDTMPEEENPRDDHIQVERDDTDENPSIPSTALENQRILNAGEVGTSECGKKRKKQDYYGEEIFKPGGMQPPLNPYFVVDVRENRANEMHFPIDVIRDHKIQLPETLVLVDPKGRTFETKLRSWKDGRVKYNGGWKAIKRANMVKIGDKLICEFIGNGQGVGDMHLKISSFPAT